MRGPIISAIRSVQIVLNPFGDDPEDLEIAGGYYIAVHDPVNGPSIEEGPFENWADARAALEQRFDDRPGR